MREMPRISLVLAIALLLLMPLCQVVVPAQAKGALYEVKGNGWIDSGSKKTFDFKVDNKPSEAKGKLEYNDRQADIKLSSIFIVNVAVEQTATGLGAWFEGACKINGVNGYFWCYIEDNGEPGKGIDFFSIDIEIPGGCCYSGTGSESSRSITMLMTTRFFSHRRFALYLMIPLCREG